MSVDNYYSDRRSSERIPTEIQGKVNEDTCLISNLSDGGALLLSSFKGKLGQEISIQFKYSGNFFEKKGIIRETTSVSMPGIRSVRNNMFRISISFTEPISDNDFVNID